MPKWILRGARLRQLRSASITHLSWDQEVTDKGGKHWNHNIVPVAVSGKKGGVGAVCRFSQTDKGGSRGSTTKLHLLRDRKIS